MKTTQQRQAFIKSRAFKVLVLVVYVYSFIQLDADESPISIQVERGTEPAASQEIRIQLERPFKLMIKLFGKDTPDND
jgi:hypothetical protein